MKKLLSYGAHVLTAMLGGTLVGGLTLLVSQFGLGGAAGSFLTSQYSPFFWGATFLYALFSSKHGRSKSAMWVWLFGLMWLGVRIFSDLTWYDPRWCNGCSEWQFVSSNYFSYRSCMQECLGVLLATGPMLNTIAYSVGTAVGLKFRNHSASIPRAVI